MYIASRSTRNTKISGLLNSTNSLVQILFIDDRKIRAGIKGGPVDSEAVSAGRSQSAP
jgi:hypothetical protein